MVAIGGSYRHCDDVPYLKLVGNWAGLVFVERTISNSSGGVEVEEIE